ncbi:MAG: hypothetical protein DRI90_13310 [Deltaproteobacteria bacterium]|nr:MAG: hypothetical protein DRI90_13310 [Deltaproteobacteria bacterium]
MSFRIPALVVLASAAVAASVAPACGGKAVIDDVPLGSGGSASSSSSTSSGSSSSSSGTPQSLCVQACGLLDGCLVGGSCGASCNAIEPDCKPEQDALLECVIEHLVPNYPCNLPDECVVPVHGLVGCTDNAQTGGTCSSDTIPGCSCSVYDQQNNLLDMSCEADGGVLDCTCRQNDEVIGTCSQPGFSECDPYADCCATLFFVPGLQ